ncbi:Gfo/Idh/MocA family protein [Bacillus nitratireducens]|uniref:Gfo/Idh/MocA family oxidoreductase n=1 Tax=Bacillus nitratireducens TaxID=2026193 RepID=A0ABU6PJW9_9BACI|nr:Gfo/Idh/MocA family oxidoreductase [Bacillus nitratireducens]MDR4171260.1 Gfo/Idh/MocA family oxidoreductase [Bacillus nitratireducens]MED4681548.1 Gfo/Idh/MocA family oxidoreductase [Bacillus nitratireducens]
MNKPKIGMIGLGSIAQKAYLPTLTKETDWDFVGAFTPNAEKRKQVCQQYRIQDFHSIETLASECDAIFVHSSTATHYEIVSELLKKGIDVYVDKPLAATVEQAEKLVELSEKYNRKLMVGFNRRFVPMYVAAKEQAHDISWIRIEKHRTNKVGPYTYDFTMLDDYLHIVDTARWLANDDLNVVHNMMQINEKNELLYGHHTYTTSNGLLLSTAMHRHAGTNLEQIELVTTGKIIRVKNMNTFEIEQENSVSQSGSPSWDTTLKQRGFEDAVHHFIECVHGNTKPFVDGLEALKTQQLLQSLLENVNKN